MPLYDYMRSANLPYAKILETANLASEGDPQNIEKLTELLGNEESIIRYWAATGLLILKEHAENALPQLKKAIEDPSPDVALVAAEAIYYIGEKEDAINTILKAFEHKDMYVRLFALNTLEYTDDRSPQVQQAILDFEENTKDYNNRVRYDLRMTTWLKQKWDL